MQRTLTLTRGFKIRCLCANVCANVMSSPLALAVHGYAHDNDKSLVITNQCGSPRESERK
jgi:hypothetical protein